MECVGVRCVWNRAVVASVQCRIVCVVVREGVSCCVQSLGVLCAALGTLCIGGPKTKANHT